MACLWENLITRSTHSVAAARLVKFLIEMWQLDEQERVNRKYVDGTDAEITILPESWLNELSPL